MNPTIALADRPRICFIAPNAFPMLANDEEIQQVGGAELQQILIARGLAQRGYPVSMICLDFGQKDQVEIDGITVYRAYRHSAGLPILRFFWPRLTSIWRCMKCANADIYYQRTAAMITGVMAAFCKLNNKKSIFAAAGETIIRLKRDEWIFNYGAGHVDRVLVQNAEQAEIYQRVHRRRSILVPNLFSPSSFIGNSSGSAILWVSTIRQLKRPDLFLDLAEAVGDREFIIVGGPDPRERQLYETVRRRAQQLPNVEFAGFVPYSKVGQFFDRASIFVSTSESEGFPNTFLQSWIRGVPTVSFVDSGARFEGRPVGYVVESLAELISAIRELSGDPEKREQLATESRRYITENHAPEKILDRYEEIIQELLRQA